MKPEYIQGISYVNIQTKIGQISTELTQNKIDDEGRILLSFSFNAITDWPLTDKLTYKDLIGKYLDRVVEGLEDANP